MLKQLLTSVAAILACISSIVVVEVSGQKRTTERGARPVKKHVQRDASIAILDNGLPRTSGSVMRREQPAHHQHSGSAASASRKGVELSELRAQKERRRAHVTAATALRTTGEAPCEKGTTCQSYFSDEKTCREFNSELVNTKYLTFEFEMKFWKEGTKQTILSCGDLRCHIYLNENNQIVTTFDDATPHQETFDFKFQPRTRYHVAITLDIPQKKRRLYFRDEAGTLGMKENEYVTYIHVEGGKGKIGVENDNILGCLAGHKKHEDFGTKGDTDGFEPFEGFIEYFRTRPTVFERHYGDIIHSDFVGDENSEKGDHADGDFDKDKDEGEEEEQDKDKEEEKSAADKLADEQAKAKEAEAKAQADAKKNEEDAQKAKERQEEEARAAAKKAEDDKEEEQKLKDAEAEAAAKRAQEEKERKQQEAEKEAKRLAEEEEKAKEAEAKANEEAAKQEKDEERWNKQIQGKAEDGENITRTETHDHHDKPHVQPNAGPQPTAANWVQGWCSPWKWGSSRAFETPPNMDLPLAKSQRSGNAYFGPDIGLTQGDCEKKCLAEIACEQAVYSPSTSECFLGLESIAELHSLGEGRRGFSNLDDSAEQLCYAKHGFAHTSPRSGRVRPGYPGDQYFKEGFDDKGETKQCEPADEEAQDKCSYWNDRFKLSHEGCWAKCEKNSHCTQAVHTNFSVEGNDGVRHWECECRIGTYKMEKAVFDEVPHSGWGRENCFYKQQMNCELESDVTYERILEE